MGSPIQTRPQGLLGLLQLKQTGVHPTDFSSTVQSTYDLFSSYTQGLMQSEFGLFGAVPLITPALTTGQSGFRAFTPAANVPQNETWWVEHVTVGVPGGLAAADTLIASIGYTLPNISGWYPLAPTQADVITARARGFRYEPVPRPIWLPPGASIQANIVDILTGTSIQPALWIRAARIPI